MSRIQVDRWRCDRCPNEIVTERNSQPSGWASVQMWSPPLMSPLGAETRPVTLCHECVPIVHEFIVIGGGAA